MSNTVLASEQMYRPVRPVLRGQEKLIAIQNQGSASVTSASLSTLRFQPPQSDFWLPRTSYFQWDVTVSPRANFNDTVSFKRGVWSIIKSIRVSVGGNQIEYIDQYSELHQMLFELSAESGLIGADLYLPTMPRLPGVANLWSVGPPSDMSNTIQGFERGFEVPGVVR